MTATSINKEDENVGKYNVVWLDREGNKSKEVMKAQKEVRRSINHLKIFEEYIRCEQYIRSISKKDRIIFIVSTSLARLIIPKIHQLEQIFSIYIYSFDINSNQDWSKNINKVKGVFINLNELITKMEIDHNKEKFNESLSINTFNSSYSDEGQSTSGINGEFIYSQLLINCLINMKSNENDFKEFLSFFKEEYKQNESYLKDLKEFEENYLSENALSWYTNASFFFRILNKSLRLQNIDVLFLLRFMIRDIGKELNKNKCQSTIRAYRGQLMSNEEIDLLKKSLGQYISINSFLSTSLSQEVALFYIPQSNLPNDFQRVLFQIDADPRLDSVKSFSNIASLSCFPSEEEVLFMVGSIFEVIKIHRNNENLWMIELKFSSDNDHRLKPLYNHMENDYFRGKNDFLSFGRILRKMGKFDHAEKYYYRLINQLSNDDKDMIHCYFALGEIARNKGEYRLSLQWFNKALNLSRKTLKVDHYSIAKIHNSIANLYLNKGDYKRSLLSYEKALNLWISTFGSDHPKVATCLNNIGNVYEMKNEYLKSLDLFEQALIIYRKHLPNNHTQLGRSQSSFANLHFLQGHYDKALNHYQISLNIYQKSLPLIHPEFARTFRNIGLVYEEKGNSKQALTYFQKSAHIRQSIFSSKHPDLIQIKQDIERVDN